ncbi:MAG: MFS transporter [Candidatus Tectimicrobiota bacterium]|nr:MAG: MFS transporter [Candidatus Tectomicrobia bacterium]
MDPEASTQPGRTRALRPRRFFYGWVIVAVSFLTLFLVVGTRFSLGVFYVAILEAYGWSRAQTAGAFSLMLVVHAAFSLVVGALFDRLGPRRLFPLGGLAIALGFAACSQIRTVWQLYVFLGVVAAAGISSLAFVPHMALVSAWFVRRRGLATGIAYAGIGGGQLLLAPAIQELVSAFGWRAAFLILAAVICATVVPLTAVFQRRHPEELGLYPDGLPPPAAAGEAPATAAAREDWTLARAVRTPAFWLLMLVVMGLGVMLNTLMLHLLAHLSDAGYDKLLGATLLGLTGALRSLGGLGVGWLSDTLGREKAYTLGSALAFGGVVLLMGIHKTAPVWPLYLFVLFYGLGQGAMGPVYAAATADLFPGRSLGTILGLLEAAYGLGGAFGAFVAGYLYDVLGSYRGSFLIVLAAIALSCTSLWLAAPRRRQRPGKEEKP